MIDIASLKVELESRIAASDTPADILKSKEFRELYASIPTLAVDERKEFGQKVNELKETIARAVAKRQEQLSAKELPAIDITAPFDVNAAMPALLPSDQGTIHPLMNEIETISDIFNRMGFVTEESREIDDQYHMFESLNFPKGHPARDDWDTFMTVETDASGDPLIAPAHTSTMQNRVMRKYHDNLENNQPIAVIVPDRTFRNEDLDARHEHTFYQVER